MLCVADWLREPVLAVVRAGWWRLSGLRPVAAPFVAAAPAGARGPDAAAGVCGG
jgi:hypothetical protein